MGRQFLGEIKQCIRCNKEMRVSASTLSRGKGKYCSRLCSAFGKVELNCLICKKLFTTHECKISVGKGKFCSRKCYEVSKRIDFQGVTNHKWKGDKVGYRALHSWVTRQLGKPNKCEHCGDYSNRKYEWANKSHLYLRELTDWIRLCVPCHKKYDCDLIDN